MPAIRAVPKRKMNIDFAILIPTNCRNCSYRHILPLLMPIKTMYRLEMVEEQGLDPMQRHWIVEGVLLVTALEEMGSGGRWRFL